MKKTVLFEDLEGRIHCPKCKKIIDDLWNGEENIEPDFCPFCGQGLVWINPKPY